MRIVELKVLSAAVDEELARTSLEVFTSQPDAIGDQPQFHRLNARWLSARDSLRSAQAAYVLAINGLRVMAPDDVLL